MSCEIYPNTLIDAESKQGFLVSIWMKDPHEMHDYHNMIFVYAPPVVIEDEQWNRAANHKGIPVKADLATVTFFRSRKVRYRVTYDNIRKRPKIAALIVETPKTLPPGAESPITLDREDFLQRYLGELRIEKQMKKI